MSIKRDITFIYFIFTIETLFCNNIQHNIIIILNIESI